MTTFVSNLRILQQGFHNSSRHKIAANLGLAYDVALKYKNSRQPVEDTDQFSDAVLGLCEAANKFKTDQKTEFSTYAHRVISNRVSKEHRNRHRKIRMLITLDSDFLNTTPAEEKESLPINLLDSIMAPDAADSPSVTQGKLILKKRYLENQSFADIGRELNLTRAGASFLAKKAISHIRSHHADRIAEYV